MIVKWFFDKWRQQIVKQNTKIIYLCVKKAMKNEKHGIRRECMNEIEK